MVAELSHTSLSLTCPLNWLEQPIGTPHRQKPTRNNIGRFSRLYHRPLLHTITTLLWYTPSPHFSGKHHHHTPILHTFTNHPPSHTSTILHTCPYNIHTKHTWTWHCYHTCHIAPSSLPPSMSSTFKPWNINIKCKNLNHKKAETRFYLCVLCVSFRARADCRSC